MPTEFVLGPALENVIEPEAAVAAVIAAMKGRRGIKFADAMPTEPGGKVNLELLPATDPSDQTPVNTYAFFVTPPTKVPPAGTERNPDWFFKSGSPVGSLATAHAPDKFQVVVKGVIPGVHFVQTVLEFNV